MLTSKTLQKAEQCSVPLKQHSAHLTGIGTKRESSLHRSLKYRYSGSEGVIETQVGNYVCDGLRSDGEIIEVQTGSFGPIREKIKCLAKNNKVRLIHPITNQKHIELYNSDGNLAHKRKSPRKGSIWDIFKVLIYAPELVSQRNLTIELAVIDIVEKRVNDGNGSWRRKYVSITDRSLGVWHSSIVLSKRSDYNKFIPYKKNEFFTVRDLAKKAGINAALARKTLYVLTKMGLVEKTGRQCKAPVYKRK